MVDNQRKKQGQKTPEKNLLELIGEGSDLLKDFPSTESRVEFGEQILRISAWMKAKPATKAIASLEKKIKSYSKETSELIRLIVKQQAKAAPKFPMLGLLIHDLKRAEFRVQRYFLEDSPSHPSRTLAKKRGRRGGTDINVLVTAWVNLLTAELAPNLAVKEREYITTRILDALRTISKVDKSGIAETTIKKRIDRFCDVIWPELVNSGHEVVKFDRRDSHVVYRIRDQIRGTIFLPVDDVRCILALAEKHLPQFRPRVIPQTSSMSSSFDLGPIKAALVDGSSLDRKNEPEKNAWDFPQPDDRAAEDAAKIASYHSIRKHASATILDLKLQIKMLHAQIQDQQKTIESLQK